uniref:Ig-like domain-containing protein n=1 Tax=Cairina moschata TaxID=8855 RepID=A0A8C3CE89_CAIMO
MVASAVTWVMWWSLKELIAPEPVQKQPVVAWGRAGSGGEEGAKLTDLSGEGRPVTSTQKDPTDFDEKLGTSPGVWTGGEMANPVPSACCVVLAAVVVVYAQRHSQQDSHIQYERVGADVTMKCGSMDWDAAVTWTANGTDIDDSHLNGSYLILKNVDLTQSGQYSCYEGSSWHLKYQTYLRVGTPPKEPVLMCRSNNYPKGFYCSWHLPSPTYIPNSFNISVIHGTREMVCEKDIFPKNRCHIRYLQLFSTVKYKVTLTVTNALGKNSTSLTFDEFAIGNFRGRTWPLRASVGVGLLRAQHLLPERWAREGPGFPGGASACLGVRWSHAGILLVPSLWWFHSAGQPNCATTALSLPFLKGRGGENKMKRAQGLK